MNGFALSGARALILGVNGGFGRSFAASLKGAGMAVWGVDLHEVASVPDHLAGYLRADVRAPSEELRHAIHGASLVVAPLHADVLLSAFSWLCGELTAGALLVDTLSVKVSFAELAAKSCAEVELLSIDPLFAPSLGFHGQDVICVELRGGDRTEAFLTLLESAGSHVHRMSAEGHDRIMAVQQVALHALLLSLAQIAGEQTEGTVDAATAPYRLAKALMARMMSQNPHVYWEIQHMNPYSKETRAALVRALGDLSNSVDANDFSSFEARFSSPFARSISAAGYPALCQEVFRHVAGRSRT